MALKFKKTGLPTLLAEDSIYKDLRRPHIGTLKRARTYRRLHVVPWAQMMIINHLEKLFVTNDAATILKELEVFHPAAKLLVMASQQQESEMGDGTNFVVAVAGELLGKAEEMLRMGLPLAEIIEGYELAVKEAEEMAERFVVDQVSDMKDKKQLMKIIKGVISAKQYGNEDFLGDIVADACLSVMPKNEKYFNVDNVRVVKILGGSHFDTKMVKGMVFHREPEGIVTRAEKAKVAIFTCAIDIGRTETKGTVLIKDAKEIAEKAKVAIFTCAIDIGRTETKGTVLIKDAKEMLSYSKGEESRLENEIKGLADAGIKVLVTGSAVSDLALHFINRYGMMVLKILSKFELRRLCRVTGATVLARVGVPMAEEIGFCDVVETVEIGSDRCTVFRQEGESSKTVSIVVRGGTVNYLDDIERSIDDAVNNVKSIAQFGEALQIIPRTLVENAGFYPTAEIANLSLLAHGEKIPGLKQYSVIKFGEALQIIPRTLVENAGFDSTAEIANLFALHEQGSATLGFNVEEGGQIDAAEEKIFDSLAIKLNALRLATDAALNVLRVDQIIMSKPAGGPKPRKPIANDED
ncbi:T-complex protein 1, theta subunit domain-containing protein [Rozella allomycis CSF55]|uniref:CCT-theta n=1 Tax=Rozella allomycis (strain CSF55) TaxID=988480 RepID=A0A075B489_ROZAC|nr:T-complex protein 1, theta subunit domain-containing protein [Rozella allomycis CSF55]|eukprot:EPZ35981.1 T-complex protein 1, theta subunit domain-containing protein [Rozella allomycis CSF55]